MSNKFKLLKPIGGGVDDSNHIQAAVNSVAINGKGLILSGEFTINTGINIPSHTVIYGTPSTIITQNLTSNIGFKKNGFSANVIISATGTITASNTVGTKTVSSSIAVAVGGLVQLLTADGLHGSIYTVTATSGNGPYTLTVDRPIVYQFTNNDASFALTSRPTGIVIHGNGMTMTGTGNRYMEFAGAYHCLVEDVFLKGTVGASITDQACSFDIGGVENIWRRVHLDGYSDMLDGIDLESNERSLIDDCSSNNVRYGFGLYDCTDCEVRSSTAYNCHAGVGVIGDITTVGGSGIKIIGGSYFGNTTVISSVAGCGIYIGNGSSSLTKSIGTIISNIDCKYNGNGIYVDGSTAPLRVKISNSTITNNTSNGILITSGALGTNISNCDITANTNADISAQAEAYCSNIICNSVSLNTGTFDFTLSNFQITSAVAATGSISITAGNIVSLVDGYINLSNGAYGVFITGAGSVVKAENLRITGGTYGVAVAGGGAGTFRQGNGFECTSTTPVITGGVGSSYYSRGAGDGNPSVTAAGTGAGQDITWPNIKTTDTVMFRTRTIGGTQTGYTSTITAGTKVTVTFGAADTSTYDMIVL